MIHPKDKEIREKLIARGAEHLTDAELVSILLGDAPSGVSAVDMAAVALADAGEEGLAVLSRMDISRLRTSAGMGVRRAAAVAVAFEAGRRAARAEAGRLDTITTDLDAVRIFGPMLSDLPHEEFWTAFLSSSGRVMEKMKVSQGGVSGTVVDHKLIVKRAVERLSTSIIVLHNHPSGQATPSDEDRSLTAKLRTAASLFDIELLDHIIIARGGHFSFRKEGLLG